MIKPCDIENLSQCAEIAFYRNNLPESNCAYCPNSKESIFKDFEAIINNPDCRMIGFFSEDVLIGVLGCFFNPDNLWVDCIGPFFKNSWNHDHAKQMVLFSKAALGKAIRYNFYFNAANENCHQLMVALAAERQDNEYILLLDKADHKPQQIEHHIIRYKSEYEAELMALHDNTFPDVYLTGKDIIAAIDKTREVFCVLDEDGVFSGYGVLNYADHTKRLTAEVFAVNKEKRGNGYGWALLNAVVESAFSKHNGNAIDLVVDKLNTNARALYDSCGFKLLAENEVFCLRV